MRPWVWVKPQEETNSSAAGSLPFICLSVSQTDSLATILNLKEKGSF